MILANASPAKAVVFDLDSTLFDVSHRTRSIFSDFLSAHRDSVDFTEMDLKVLQAVQIESFDWGIKEPILRALSQVGGVNLSPAVLKLVRDHWRKHFFSNGYLEHDRPYKGSIKYVQDLAAANIPILYLTGRDAINMRTGTIQSLHHHGFPLSDEKNLIMKPAKGAIEDDDYKVDRLRTILKTFESVWFFENEPFIIRATQRAHPNLKIIFLNTTHSRREPAITDLPTIEMDGY
jgi:hypothetical protein